MYDSDKIKRRLEMLIETSNADERAIIVQDILELMEDRKPLPNPFGERLYYALNPKFIKGSV